MLNSSNLKFLQGVFLLSGTIIGVGMFGIPFVFSRSGFILGTLELLLITAALTVIHLAYGEILLRTETIHRLPGYVNVYFGKYFKIISTASYITGLTGSLLVYIIIGGNFLNELLTLPDFGGETIFWLAGSLFIFFSIRQTGLIDTIINSLLIGFLSFFIIWTLPYFRETALPAYNLKESFLPYGVLLFSLAGATAIPEIRALVGNSYASRLKRIIICGTALPAILYLLFAVSIVGVSGMHTTNDALSGLTGLLPRYLIYLGFAIGVLASFTSYVVIGLTLKETFYFDFGIRHKISWLITTCFPFLLFLLGIANFITIISFLGAVTGGIDAILTLAVFQKAKKFGRRNPDYSLNMPKIIIYALVFMFILGIVWEGISLLKS